MCVAFGRVEILVLLMRRKYRKGNPRVRHAIDVLIILFLMSWFILAITLLIAALHTGALEQLPPPFSWLDGQWLGWFTFLWFLMWSVMFFQFKREFYDKLHDLAWALLREVENLEPNQRLTVHPDTLELPIVILSHYERGYYDRLPWVQKKLTFIFPGKPPREVDLVLLDNDGRSHTISIIRRLHGPRSDV